MEQSFENLLEDFQMLWHAKHSSQLTEKGLRFHLVENSRRKENAKNPCEKQFWDWKD